MTCKILNYVHRLQNMNRRKLLASKQALNDQNISHAFRIERLKFVLINLIKI